MRRLLLLALVVLVPTGAWVGSSEATFPGPNGKLVFVRTTEPCKYRPPDWVCPHRLWTSNPDGSGLRQLTTGTGVTNPSWSPDGRRIAFFDGTPFPRYGALWLINADGTGLRKLPAPLVVGPPLAIGWFPDGKRLIWAGSRGVGKGYAIKSTDLAGRNERIHVNTGSAINPLAAPQISPDGTRLAYVGRRWLGREDFREALFISRLDGKGRRWIADLIQLEGRPYDWSPDGRRLVYIAPRTWNTDTSYHQELWVVNVDGSGRRQLTRNEVEIYGQMVEAWNLFDPAWAPDGRTILFKRFTLADSVPLAEVAFIPAEGGEMTTVQIGGGCTRRANGGPRGCTVEEPDWGRRPAG